MAKKNFILVRMINPDTSYFIVRKRNAKAEKLSMRKYDPTIRKHVLLVEKKMPKSS
jgi:ribosomal protein L33